MEWKTERFKRVDPIIIRIQGISSSPSPFSSYTDNSDFKKTKNRTFFIQINGNKSTDKSNIYLFFKNI